MPDSLTTSPAESQGQLLAELEEGWAPLPTRTLLALVVGGLRVRMMRSLVTMVSIVLAIAFLTYTGFSSKLCLNLAREVERRGRLTPLGAKRVAAALSVLREADLFAGLPPGSRRRIALDVGLGEIDRKRLSLAGLSGPLGKARLDREEADAELARLEADPGATGANLKGARSRAVEARQSLESFERRRRSLSEEIELGEWLASGRDRGDPEMSARLVRALAGRKERLMDRAARPAQLGEAEISHLGILLDLAEKRPGTAAVRQAHDGLRRAQSSRGVLSARRGGQASKSTRWGGGTAAAIATLRRALDEAKTARAASRLRIDLRRAGISVESTLEGSSLDTWLIVMALLTCAVGIANAVLMSVTERFREIGTMKCLGAQDGLVVKMFLLESCMLGMIGAALGIALGVLVALSAGLVQFGGFAFRCFPLAQGASVVGWSFLAGVFLAVVGAVYPALVAARMEPVDALRADE